MDTFAEIADERRRLADQLAGLDLQQQATPSLCAGWTVHDVLAHLTMPMTVGLPRFAVAMLRAGGNFDRANRQLTERQARHSFAELITVLRERAESRFTPPGEGPEAPLTDLLVHGLDIRYPLGLHAAIAPGRARKSLDALMQAPPALVAKGRLDGLRFEAADLDWGHGSGAVVAGPVASLLLAVTGRPAGLATLTGDGTDRLRERLRS